jgi:hypothetical protein
VRPAHVPASSRFHEWSVKVRRRAASSVFPCMPRAPPPVPAEVRRLPVPHFLQPVADRSFSGPFLFVCIACLRRARQVSFLAALLEGTLAESLDLLACRADLSPSVDSPGPRADVKVGMDLHGDSSQGVLHDACRTSVVLEAPGLRPYRGRSGWAFSVPGHRRGPSRASRSTTCLPLPRRLLVIASSLSLGPG